MLAAVVVTSHRTEEYVVIVFFLNFCSMMIDHISYYFLLGTALI